MRGGPVVGFDLDMTLVDSRPGIQRVWDEVSAVSGLPIDSALSVTRLGPPLAVEAAYWVGPEGIPDVVACYREHYARFAIEPTLSLPGAHEAMDAVRADGGSVLVVTAKNVTHARLHLDHLGLPADVVVGDLWGAAKGAALREHGASVYVGDHVHDIDGARAADAVAVSVATGPSSAHELTASGADAVLADLTEFPGWWREHLLDVRLAVLEERLRGWDRVVVAFSGGADSAFLLAAATRVIGPDHVVAATAVSASLPAAELAGAREFAASLGVRHITPETHELSRAGYRANDGDRCAHCKAELVDVLNALAADPSMAAAEAAVLTGTNADDARAGFRPGIAAAADRGAQTPLLDAGLTKSQVRAASRRWGLVTADKPAAACLSSRVAFGVEVTSWRLARIERAEVAVRRVLTTYGLTVWDLRVRDLGEAARIEADRDLLTRLDDAGAEASEAVVVAVLEAGFAAADVDPSGFRSGSMNELLSDPQRFR